MSDPNLPEGVTQRDIDNSTDHFPTESLEEETCSGHGSAICEICAIEKERERCAKIAEDVGYSEGLEHIDNQFLGYLRDLKDFIAEEIRSGK